LDFQLILANASHVKNVPGRKTDVNDATWLADLLAHGLIRASFVPDAQTQEMRNLLRTRKQLVREKSSHILRVQKTLEDLFLALRQPLPCRGALTLRAMPVAAGVVGDLGVAAFVVLAARDMAAEGGRAAVLDCRHHLQLAEADVAGIGRTPCRPVIAEDIPDLQRWTRGHGCGRLCRRRFFPALLRVLARLRQQVEIELLSEIAPGLKRAAIMFNPDTAPLSAYMLAFETAARSLKVLVVALLAFEVRRC
jgi:hypothetical protein